MDDTYFYCSDCGESHYKAQGHKHCAVCGHSVCPSAFAAKHSPQDFHHVVSVLDGAVDSAADAIEQMGDWIEDKNIPLSANAAQFLDRAKALLIEQHQQIARLRDEDKQYCTPQKVG